MSTNIGVAPVSDVVLEELVFTASNISSTTRKKDSLGNITAGGFVLRELLVDSLRGLGELRYLVRFVNGSGDNVAVDAGRLDNLSVSDVVSKEFPQAASAGGPSGFVVVTREGEVLDDSKISQVEGSVGVVSQSSGTNMREYSVWLRQLDNVLFTIKGIQYKLTIQRISAGKVLIHIEDYPREFLLMNKEKGYLDMGSDGVYDAKIELMDVSADKAKLSLLRFYD